MFSLIILGHEHIRSTVGNVCILGSPWPCSINETAKNHGVHTWSGSAVDAPVMSQLTWASKTGYFVIPWQELSTVHPTGQFMRITGQAESAQAGQVVQEIAKLRAEVGPEVYLITNQVKVIAQDSVAIDQAGDDLEQFDPLAVFYQALPVKFHERCRNA